MDHPIVHFVCGREKKLRREAAAEIEAGAGVVETGVHVSWTDVDKIVSSCLATSALVGKMRGQSEW